MFYVYAYFDQTKYSALHSCGFSPFYVGKGKEDRAYHHLFESNIKGDSNKHKANTIKKLLNLGIKPHIEIISNSLTEDEAYGLEISLIKLWGRADLGLGPLTNMTDGGEGTTNKVYTDAYRQKLSIGTSKAFEEGKLKVSDTFKYSRVGVKDSEETKRKRTESRIGYSHSEETKQKIKESRAKYLEQLEDRSALATMKGKKHTDESRQKMSNSIKSALANKETKHKRSLANSGGNNPRAKSCEIFGVVYSCLSHMEKELGINKRKLMKDASFKFIE